MLLLVADACHGKSATAAQIHVLSRLLQRPSTRASLAEIVQTGLPVEQAIIRYEPALERGLDLLSGMGYIDRMMNGRYRLTPNGAYVVDALHSTQLFAEERAALATLPGKFTTLMSNRLLNKSLFGLA